MIFYKIELIMYNIKNNFYNNYIKFFEYYTIKDFLQLKTIHNKKQYNNKNEKL